MIDPKLSVIVVTYNSRRHLERCLPALQAVDVSHEVVIVDNGSTDDTLTWVRSEFPDVRVIESGYNAGYAGGNNIGVAASSGEYVLIVNPDTTLLPGSAETMVAVCERSPEVVVTPKILRPDGTINACGTTMHFSGITSCNGLGQSAEAYSGTFSTLLVSGAAFALSRACWEDVGGFDEAFFMYMEDVDLSIRLWLKGYSIACAADAVVIHDYDLRMTARKFYYLERNRLMMLAKLYRPATLWRLWPGLVIAELATLSYALRRGPRFLWSRLIGYGWLLRHTGRIHRARAKVRAGRVLSDQTLVALMRPYLPFQDLTTPRLANLLALITTPVFRTVHRAAVHL